MAHSNLLVLLSFMTLLACSGEEAAGTSHESASSSTGTSSSSSSSGAGGSGGAPGADTIYGVTLDNVSDLPAITLSLEKLTYKPTARIVFDEFIPATDYADAAAAIHKVSNVMGEILDSYYVSLYSPEEYQARTTEYLDTLGADVDIWEIGNEINGEWLCGQDAMSCTPEQTADVVAKMTSAFDLVKARGRPAALTLYYNQDCWSDPNNEVFAWAEANVPDKLKQGLDYILFSYYEDDCNGLQPDWPAAFAKLATMFPTAKLGFGECGTTIAANKAVYIDRYYRRTLAEPRYIGGNFWWYFREDMVPMTSPLWQTLDDAIAGR
jgi:hypothetical protein